MQAKLPVLLALMMMLPSGQVRAAEAEPVHLLTPLAYGTHLPGLGDSALKLAKRLAERSSGTLILDLKEPGDGTKPGEILDKVSQGTVDAGFGTASLWAAKLPAASLFSGFPFGPDGREYYAWFDQGDGRRLYQEMYDHAGVKVHVIPCAMGGAEAGGWFAKEIKTPDDIKGLRMRIFGLGGRVMSRAGAITVLVPGGDLAAAFAANKIDAAELYTPAVDERQSLQDKVKLIYVPGWHQPETVLELLVNKDRWDRLSEEQRGLIDDACRDTLQTTLGESATLQAEALADLTAKNGVRVEQWPDAVLSTLRSAWADVAKEEAEQDYFFKTVLDDITAFRQAEQSAAQPPPSVGTDAPPSASAAEAKPGP